MKIEDQVCSLELSKQLKGIGVKQESLFFWIITGCEKCTEKNELVYAYKADGNPPNNCYSAFTASELGEFLPFFIEYKDKKYWYHTGKVNKNNEYYNEHEVNYTYNEEATIGLLRGNTEADARAKMLIYLLENNLMDLQNA
jgi:hypothetical protein